MNRAAAVLLVMLALLAAACVDAADAPIVSGPSTEQGSMHLSLGDSVAAGNGASDAARTSFAALLASREGLVLHNLAVPGATTQDVIDGQLPDATALLDGSRDVRLITISAGGNDLAALIPNAACVEDPLPAACPLDETLADIEERLHTIIGAIRVADPDLRVVLLAYPNFFSGTGHAFEAPAGRVLPRFGDMLRRVGARYARTAVAEAAPAFEGRGGALTHVLDPAFDPHPNDAGHRAIADAFAAALDEARID